MVVKKKRRGRRLRWLGVLAVAVAAGVFFLGSRGENPVLVEVEEVSRRDIQERVAANGRIQPVTQVVINPEVSGEIVELPLKEGAAVAVGDLLVRIKPDTYIANVNSAEAGHLAALAGMELAKANLEQAELELARSQQLFDREFVSDSDLLAARTAWNVARASYDSSVHQSKQAEAALDRAKDDLAKTTIYSPLAGTITSLKSQVGERVVGSITMAGTEIMTIADLSEMEARVDVGEMDVVLIDEGQRAVLEVDAFRGRKFSGVVTDIANSANGAAAGQQQEATRFEIKIRIQETEAFRPGMSVSAEIETRFRENGIAVPIQSVTTRVPPEEAGAVEGEQAAADGAAVEETEAGGETHERSAPGRPVEVVFVVEGGVARAVPVTRGISDDAYVEIVEGLSEGARVVTGNYQAINRELEHGKTVRME